MNSFSGEVGVIYCPVCLDYSLEVDESGAISIVANNLPLNGVGRFLFNTRAESQEELIEMIEKEAAKVIKWHLGMQHRPELLKFRIGTPNYSCKKGCPVNPKNLLCVGDTLIPLKTLRLLVANWSKKYGVAMELDY